MTVAPIINLGTLFGESDVLRNALPRRAGRERVQEGALYVLDFANGLVKAGRTATPSSRIGHHVREVQRYSGASLNRGWLSRAHSNYYDTEMQLVAFGRQQASRVEGNEFLYGADFQAIVAFAQHLPMQLPVQGPEMSFGGLSSRKDNPLVQAVSRLWGLDEAAQQKRAASSLASTPVHEWQRVLPAGRIELGTVPLEMIQQVAEAMGVPADAVCDLSYMDVIEWMADSQTRCFRAQQRAAIAELRLMAREQGRFDLLKPLVDDDAVCPSPRGGDTR